jgi:hypothetical protein
VTLDDAQAGQLRRILALSAQLPDDWSGMHGKSSLQEDFGALRFQLAYMSWVLALTHRHRLPAAPGLFKPAFARLIEKMLSPDVWSYWYYVGTGGGPFNASLGPLPPRWNPVDTDNIMYSAYVQSMALLFHHLFDDDRFARPGALTFRFKTAMWGRGGQEFAYDERSLSDHLYWMLVEKGYLGIACEPNCVFQICNQPAILGFRMGDVIYGGARAAEVTRGYLAAWEEFGMLSDSGGFAMMVMERERKVVTPGEAPWIDFWLASLMHAWNPEFVETIYRRRIARWRIDGADGEFWIDPRPSLASGLQPPSGRDQGWAAVAASEVGDEETRTGLLAFADRWLEPTWDRGALFYPRSDRLLDDAGRPLTVDPHTGNVLYAWARLNVKDGLRTLYEAPWTASHFAEPALAELPEDVDVLEARYDAASRMLCFALRPVSRKASRASVVVANAVDRGDWTLTRDGAPHADRGCREGDDLHLDLPIGPATTRYVLAWR